jgi:hypothetical protein
VLTGVNETSDPNSWKKFSLASATMSITYNHPPDHCASVRSCRLVTATVATRSITATPQRPHLKHTLGEDLVPGRVRRHAALPASGYRLLARRPSSETRTGLARTLACRSWTPGRWPTELSGQSMPSMMRKSRSTPSERAISASW